ncbi:MAG: hypothetical protein MJ177_00110 [Clostridia bacterium]|nr:hypothetical protein [Clostridia bacterium]
MKKLIAIVLCILTAVSCTAFSFAAEEECTCTHTPVVTVRGFGSLMEVENGSGEYTGMFSYDKDEALAFAKEEVKKLVDIALKKDTGTFVSEFYNTLDFFLGALRCDLNGNSVKTVRALGCDELKKDKHKGDDLPSVSRGIEGDDYVFEYDFRLDPLENADLLYEFIEGVKALTRHGKVTVVAHSEGTCVTGAYLVKYGTKSVNKVIFVGAAVNGISLIGNAFTKNISLDGRADALEQFAATALGFDGVNEFINLLISALNKAHILGVVTDALDILLDSTIDGLYRDYLVDMFATMPGLWSFVPDEYYENAKAVMFGTDEKYDALCEKLDNYHYTVQNKINSVFEKAKEDGTAVAFCGGYGISSIPVAGEAPVNSDFLIDTKYTSFGATTALFGEKLENTGGEYASPDGIIDASTCLFPEYTWFAKYQSHNNFCEPFRQFIKWLIDFDGQPTVNSDAAYPQFLTCDGHKKLVAVNADDDILNQGSFAERFVRAVMKLVEFAISKIMTLFA